ncbi:hypothetical protein CBS9595_002849 [Malassezia furfur]|nr:hypothetical protein CBS9595_002849 [Malassezia furfur]
MTYPTAYPAFAQAEFFEVQWLAPHVLGVAFHRAPVNAFHVAMWSEMRRIFAHIKLDGDVLSDTALQEIMARDDAARISIALRELIDRFQQAITSIEVCERPVIAVAHSHAIGLAVDIMSAADIRYAAADVRFSIREAAIGLAADIGTLQRFPKIVGNDSLTRELVYTARFFDADEAQRIGFVSRVLPTRDDALRAAIATAETIAAHSPVAVTGSKQALVYSRDHTVPEGLQFMQYLNAALLQTEDFGTAAMAAMAKTKPTFAKL